MASIFHGRVKEEIHKNKTNKYWELLGKLFNFQVQVKHIYDHELGANLYCNHHISLFTSL